MAQWLFIKGPIVRFYNSILLLIYLPTNLTVWFCHQHNLKICAKYYGLTDNDLMLHWIDVDIPFAAQVYI